MFSSLVKVFAVQVFVGLVVLFGGLGFFFFFLTCAEREASAISLITRDELCNSLYSMGLIANPHRTSQLLLQPDFQFISSVALGSAQPFVLI